MTSLNVGVETNPRSSAIAGEQLINHNVRLESEQGISIYVLQTLSQIPLDFA